MPLDDSYRKASELMTSGEYSAISPSKARYGDNMGYGWGRVLGAPTMFRRDDCALCGASYALWYAQTGEDWYPFDSSYFLAFNDEPSAEDEPLRGVTVLDVAREYIERNGAARGVSKSETGGTATIKKS